METIHIPNITTVSIYIQKYDYESPFHFRLTLTVPAIVTISIIINYYEWVTEPLELPCQDQATWFDDTAWEIKHKTHFSLAHCINVNREACVGKLLLVSKSALFACMQCQWAGRAITMARLGQ